MPESGTPWTDSEIRVAVEAYFTMLLLELSAATYVKTEQRLRCERLLPARSSKSIDYKWCNMSAVLDEAQLPWIPGFKPLANYQDRLRELTATWLLEHPLLRSTLEGATQSE